MTKKTIRAARLLLVVLAGALIYGCAGAPLPDVVYPLPPDEPRIKFVKSIRGGGDLEETSVAAEILIGKGSSFNLGKPMGIYAEPGGKIYVTDTAYSDIFIYDTKAKKADSLNTVSIEKYFSKPIGVVAYPDGRMVASDSQRDTVLVIDKTGKIAATLKPATPFKQPTGIALDTERKRLYISDTYNHNIRVFDSETYEETKVMGKRGKEEGEFNFPSFLAVDSKGALYVTDSMNGRIQIFDKDGKFVRAFGQFGDLPGMFARPKGIGVDSEGHIYVVDAAFNNIQIFDEEGRILLPFAGYGEGRGELILPAGLAVDKDDYIYVVDSFNRRLQVFEYLGEKAKVRDAAAEAAKKAGKK